VNFKTAFEGFEFRWWGSLISWGKLFHVLDESNKKIVCQIQWKAEVTEGSIG